MPSRRNNITPWFQAVLLCLGGACAGDQTASVNDAADGFDDSSAVDQSSTDSLSTDSTSTDQVGDPAPSSPVIEPTSGSGFGHFVLRVDVSQLDVAADEVLAVRVGDIATYQPQVAEDGWLEVTVQGGPPGEAAVVLETGGDSIELPTPFTYLPPNDPVFERMTAIGASLTQGVQRGVPSFSGGLMSPPGQLARQAGAFFPMPLLVPGLFPQITPSHVSPPPRCDTPGVAGFIRDAVPEILEGLEDENGVVGAHVGRIDPNIMVHNLAVGNSGIATLLTPPDPDDLAATLLSYFVLEPYRPLLTPLQYSQFDRLVELEPTLIMSTDLYGNDIIGASVGLGSNPSEQVLIDAIDDVVDALAGTGAQVFLSNLPMPSTLPRAGTRLARAIEEGDQSRIDSINETDRLAGVANTALQDAADGHPNVHVVDTTELVDRLIREGVVTEQGVMTATKFGGLVGLDGLHFTDTGYALLANLFAEAINDTLGTTVPLIDIESVALADVDSPWALREAGVDVDACNE